MKSAQKNLSPLTRLLLLFLLLVYWGVSLQHLTALPLAYEDEAWQASTGWKLATQGIFGSDLFAGYHEMEQHYFGFLPLYPFSLALLFRFADVGLFQARFVGVACGLVALALTFSLAQRLYRDARIGFIALFVLLFVRGFMLSPLHPTGILFLDAVRIARYDVLPPVFGLLALHAYLSATRKNLERWYFCAGLCAALAGLAHLYGSFFFAVLLALLLWNRPHNLGRATGAMCLGFFLPWLLYLGYVLQDVEAWRAQTRAYGERFELLNPRWYWENVQTEIKRYSVGFLRRGNLFLRPGFWFMLASLGASAFALLARAFSARDARARLIVTPLLLVPFLFALLLHVKFTNYLLLVAPFAALAIGWLYVQVWDWLGATKQRARLRVLAFVILAIVFFEGARQIVQQDALAQTTTPYPKLVAQLQSKIPKGARVLGLHTYALGWEQYEYRASIVPFLLANPTLEAKPQPLAIALDAQAPAFILFDQHMRKFLQTGDAQTRAEFEAWMQARGAHSIAQVDDATYGAFEIYRLNP